jgi:hypothetical protein
MIVYFLTDCAFGKGGRQLDVIDLFGNIDGTFSAFVSSRGDVGSQ